MVATLAAPRAGAGPVPVELPELAGVHVLEPLEVFTYAENLPWAYAEVDGTEILSLCSDAATGTLITMLRARNALVRDTLPKHLREDLAAPAMMVLYEAEDRAELRRGLLRPQYVLTETGAELSRRRPPEGIPQTRWTESRDVAVFSANLRYGPPPDATLSRRWPYSAAQAVRFILERQYPAMPAWLIEGLDGHLRDAAWIDDTFVLAPLPWVSERATQALRRDPRIPVTLLPLAEMFASGPGEHPRAGDATFSLWEAQAALFVRWALESDHRAQRETFWRFVMRAASEPVTPEMFFMHFGMSMRAAEDALWRYLGDAVRNEITIRLPRRWDRGRVKLREATEEQIGRIKGCWERQLAFAIRDLDPEGHRELLARARRTVRRGYELGRWDARLVALRGFIELDVGEPGRAAAFLEEAVRHDVDWPAAHLELARLRLREALTRPGGRLGTISVAQLQGVLEPLRRARGMVPLRADIYRMMAEATAECAALIEPEDLEILAEGVRRFPRNSELVCQVAEVHAANGLRLIALEMLEHSLSLGPDASGRRRLEAMHLTLSDPVPFRLRTTSASP